MNHEARQRYPTANGYMTETTRAKYIASAIESGVLPKDAHRMPEIISLSAPEDTSMPIQFWQLFSVMGPERIVAIVRAFYTRVFADEEWFTSVFERVGGVEHHINTQASMWADAMGGGPYYHGADYRLSFHHTHNAHQLMTSEGARRWVELMVQTLDDSADLKNSDPRIRRSLNTFLAYFFGKYAEEFDFPNVETFGETNPRWRPLVNFRSLSEGDIEAMTEDALREGLEGRGIDVSVFADKPALVRKATSL